MVLTYVCKMLDFPPSKFLVTLLKKVSKKEKTNMNIMYAINAAVAEKMRIIYLFSNLIYF